MNEITGQHIPRRRPGLHVSHERGAVIVDEHGADVASLDDTAAALFELCDGETNVEEITVAVCTVWDVDPDVAARDVRRTLRELADAQLLDWDGRS
jgi:hypothetical protein